MYKVRIELFNTKKNWYLLIIFCMFLVACLPTQTVETIPVTPRVTAVLTSPPIATKSPETAAPTATLLPLATPTATTSPIPTTTATPTPSPTSIYIQKVAEWPIAAAFFALSPDGKLLAAQDHNTGVLSIYDTTTWELKWEINEENRGMTGYVLDFSPNGKYLAGGGIEQNVYVWDISNNSEILTFPKDEVLDHLAINNEGVIVGINWPNSISMWNLKGKLLATLPFDEKFIAYFEFIPTGELLVGSFAEEQDQPIEIWRIGE